MKKTYTKKQIQEAIAYWKKQLAKGNYKKINEAATAVALTGEEQYLGPSMGRYRMTLKKNGRVQDTYEWECFLFNQANSDGCGDALDQFARNDPDFADLLAGEDEDDIRNVGIVEDSWEDPDGAYELSISPSTVQWEEFPAGWHAPMSSVVLEPDMLALLGGAVNESTGSPEDEIRQAYAWGKTAGLCDGLVRVSKAESAKTTPHFDLFIFEYSDGTVTWVEKDRRDRKFRTYPLTKKMNRNRAASWAGSYGNPRVVASASAEELGAVNESAVVGIGPKEFRVTLLRDQTNGLDVMADDADEAESIAREIVDSGNLYDYIDENAWYSNPVEVGDVEEA